MHSLLVDLINLLNCFWCHMTLNQPLIMNKINFNRNLVDLYQREKLKEIDC